MAPHTRFLTVPSIEQVYCARGDMENRIKECQGDLFADRTSAATMRANQLRLWFASMAHVLLSALRRIALAHPQFAEATWHYQAEAPQDRRARQSQRAPHPLCNGLGLSLRPGMAARRRTAGSGPRLPRLIGVAAYASQRGSNPRPRGEPNSFRQTGAQAAPPPYAPLRLRPLRNPSLPLLELLPVRNAG